MTASTLDRVTQVAADVFNVPADGLTPQSSPQTVESWDSLTNLNLLLALEQEFGCQIAPEDLERMTTIESVTRVVEEKLKEQNAGR